MAYDLSGVVAMMYQASGQTHVVSTAADKRQIKQLERTQDTWDPAQKVESDVDEQIRATAALERDGDEGDEDGQKVEDNIRLWNLPHPGGPDCQLCGLAGECDLRTVDDGGPAMLAIEMSNGS
jgi:hypothetical protein